MGTPITLCNSSMIAATFIIFTFSGFAALMYESLWANYLKLILGHAAYAQSFVIAVFMGGLAIGSWLAGKVAEKEREPLLLYAIVELVLGVLGLFFHQIYLLFSSLLYEGVFPLVGEGFLSTVLLWGGCALLVLPQCILLGATFPLMSAALLRLNASRPGYVLSMLYFTNSLGAAAGVLAAGLLLIPEVGLPGTSLAAGILNIIIALFAWLLSRHIPLKPIPLAEERSKLRSTSGEVDMLSPRIPLIAAAITGFASFCYEIAWIRMLVIVLGSSLQAFEIMLSAFILGLALGGAAIRNKTEYLTSAIKTAAVIQLCMASVAILTLPLYSTLFTLMAELLQGLSRTYNGYILFSISSQVIALIIMVPASFFAGMTLPVLTTALLRITRSERAVGELYAANTLGSIFGALAATHILLPLVGLRWLLALGALADAFLGLYLFSVSSLRSRSSWPRSALAVPVFILAVTFSFELDPVRMVSGVFRRGVLYSKDEVEVKYLESGKTATISVYDWREKSGESGRVIATNGKPDAGVSLSNSTNGSDLSTMVLLGALPLLVHETAADVGVIGFGSGITTDTVLTFPEVRSVETIEIEKKMIEGAKYFGEFNSRAYEDPRSRIIIGDARSALAIADQRYDIIISEPSNPWVSGVSGLFSQEFYQEAKKALKPGGILAQWIHIYELDIKRAAAYLGALQAEFPYFGIYIIHDFDLLVIASQEKFTFEEIRKDVSETTKEVLQSIHVKEPEDVKQLFLGSEVSFGPFLRGQFVAPHSDFFPRAAYEAVADRFQGLSAHELKAPLYSGIPFLSLLEGRRHHQVDTLSGALQLFTMRVSTATKLARAFLHETDELSVLASDPEALLVWNALTDCSRYIPAKLQVRAALGKLARSLGLLGDSPQAHHVWTKLLQVECLVSPEALGLGDDLRFYQALQKGDAKTVASSGTTILASPLLPPSVRHHMAAATLAALVAVGEKARVASLLQEQNLFFRGRKLPADLRFAISLAYGSLE